LFLEKENYAENLRVETHENIDRMQPKCMCLSFRSALMADKAKVVDANLRKKEVNDARDGTRHIEGSFSFSPYQPIIQDK